MNFNNSSHRHVRHNVEWFIPFESELTVESSLAMLSNFIKINNCPSLIVYITSLATHNNVGSFFIMIALDFKNLLVLNVDKAIVDVSEDLPPS